MKTFRNNLCMYSDKHKNTLYNNFYVNLYNRPNIRLDNYHLCNQMAYQLRIELQQMISPA